MTERVIFDILILASASIIATLGVILMGISIPSGKEWNNLRTTRIYLALSCIILAAINILSYLTNGYPVADIEQLEAFKNVVVLVFASWQAMMFTITLLTFLQPLYLNKKDVAQQLVVILSSGGLLLLSLFLWSSIFLVIYYIAIAAYLLQLIYYTVLFSKQYRQCLKQLEEYYDEDESYRIKWIRTIFYTALGIGILVLISLFLNGFGNNAFIVIYTAFYLYVVVRFLNYKNKGIKLVLPATITEKGFVTDRDQDRQRVNGNNHMNERELEFKKALDVWVDEKRFSEKDAGVEEIAQSLGADISFLRYYFRTYIKEDFRTWRSRLRVNEAKQMLEEDPQLSLSEVCMMVGFNDKGNFHRQFQKFMGTTPANYKYDCHEKTNTYVRESYKPY